MIQSDRNNVTEKGGEKLNDEANMTVSRGDRLISKKQLLEKYGFSYGALYRWKRMGLIPDEWFIKKSTPSGQETFFSEAQICERIELILSKKDELQLDELAKQIRGEEKQGDFLVISTKYGEKTFSWSDVGKITIRTKSSEIDATDVVHSLIKEKE